MILHTIKSDLSRWFIKKRFFMAVIGIILVNVLIILQNTDSLANNPTIVETIRIYMNDYFTLITYMIAGSVYGICYCEEQERGYYSFWTKRCSVFSYSISKIWNCFLSAFCVLALGTMIFICSLLFIMPFYDSASDAYITGCQEGMGILLADKHFFLYYLFYSMGLGMIAGILSSITFLFSLFIKNRMVVQILPALLYYLISVYCSRFALYGWSPEGFLIFPYRNSAAVLPVFFSGVLYTMAALLILWILCYSKIRRWRYA